MREELIQDLFNLIEDIDRIPEKVLVKIETIEKEMGVDIDKKEIKKLRRIVKKIKEQLIEIIERG